MKDYLRNLPKNSPEEFGKALERLIEEVVSPNDTSPRQYISKEKTTVRQYISNQLHIHSSIVSAHLSGRYATDAKKPLSTDQFKEYVNLLWKKPNGINHPEEIVGLAGAAGDKYFALIFSGWFETLTGIAAVDYFKSLTSSELTTPFPDHERQILREDLMELIREMAENCRKTRKKLILYGEYGVGKSVLLDQIRRDPILKEKFNEYCLIADFKASNSAATHLRSWYYKTVGQIPVLLHSDEEINKKKHEIQQVLSERKNLILFNHVKDVEDIARFPVEHLNRSLVIITTCEPQVRDHFKSAGDIILEVPPLSDEQALLFFQQLGWTFSSDDKSLIQEINGLVQGRPFSLYNSFHLASKVGLDECCRLIREPSQYHLEDPVLAKIFSPLDKLVQRLSPGHLDLLRKMTVLPQLKSIDTMVYEVIWQEPKPKLILSSFAENGLIQKIGANSWVIQPQVLHYLKSKFNLDKNTEEEILDWQTKVYTSPKFQKELNEKHKHLKSYMRKVDQWTLIHRRLLKIRTRVRTQEKQQKSQEEIFLDWNLYFPERYRLSSIDYLYAEKVFNQFRKEYHFLTKVEQTAPIMLIPISGAFCSLQINPLSWQTMFWFCLLGLFFLGYLFVLIFDFYKIFNFILTLEFIWNQQDGENDSMG